LQHHHDSEIALRHTSNHPSTTNTYTSGGSVPERHAIFENIGYLAGALSYLHVQVTVDLTSVDNLITAFKKAVSDIRHTIARIDPDTQQPTNYYETQLKNQLKLMKIRNIQILDNFDTAATNLRI
jgi:hypothetical protein